MNPLDKVISFFNPVAGERRVRARLRTEIMNSKAGYEAAGKGRRWFRASSTSQNAENRIALTTLRAISRELERNNPYVGIALDVIQSTTVGTGIVPVAKHEDEEKKKLANQLMKEWAESSLCDYDGNLNLFGLQSLAIRTQSLSGEALIVKRVSNDKRMRVPLKLQLLEGDFLDHQKDQIMNTDKTIQGVQFGSNGQPSGYWLFESHPGEAGFFATKSNLVGADQIAHIYEIKRPGQVRGIPTGINVLTRLKGLDDFQDARIEQQKVAACLVGAIYNTEGDDSVKGDPLPERLEPGMLPRLGGGEQIAFNNPPSVSGQDGFVQGEQRVIATAYGITYESLTGDWRGTNFASGKMGRIGMYANVDRKRRLMLIPQMCKKIEKWFIETAVLAGHDISGVTFDWTPPKKEILDIKNELPAIRDEVRAGLNSLQGALRERGLNITDVMNELKEDFELLDKLGLKLDIDPRHLTKSGQAQAEPSEPEAPSEPDKPEDEAA